MTPKKKPTKGLKIGKPLGKNSKLRKFRAKKAVSAAWERKINKELNDPFGKLLKRVFEPQRKAHKKTQENIRATKIAKGAKAEVDAITKGKTSKGVARRKEAKAAKHSARQAKMELDIKTGSAKRKANKNIRKGMRIMGSKNMTGGSPGTRRFPLAGSEADKVASKAMKKRLKKDKGLKRKVVKSNPADPARRKEVKAATKAAKGARQSVKGLVKPKKKPSTAKRTANSAVKAKAAAAASNWKRRVRAAETKVVAKSKRPTTNKPSTAKRVLKGAGKVAKTIAKRSPIIGGIASLADYKDAYKRVAKHDQKKYDAMRAKAKKYAAKKKKK